MDAAQSKLLGEVDAEAGLVAAFMDRLAHRPPGAVDGRWFSIARTDMQRAFMALRRAVTDKDAKF